MPLPQDFEQRFLALEREVRKLRARSPLANTGLSATAPGEVSASGSLVVGGSIDVHGDANFDGDTVIGGNASITGTLSLPAGIIGNDALASPVKGGVDNTIGTTGFAMSTTSAAKDSATIAIPAGFTVAFVIAIASVTALNGTANLDYLIVQAAVNGVGGGSVAVPVQAGEANAATASKTRVLTGLAGGSISVQAFAGTSTANWAANGANIASVNALAIFTR